MSKTIDKIINIAKKKAIIPVVILLGIGVVGYTISKSYGEEVGKDKIEEENSTKIVQEYDPQEVWENRETEDFLDNYVVFSSFVGESKDRQTELFIGQYKNNEVSNIQRLTKTPESEFGPLFSDNLRIVFCRFPEYENYNGMSLDKMIKASNGFFTISSDGTRERKVNYKVWRDQITKKLGINISH